MIAIPLSKSERTILVKEILAKGGAFMVLICWVGMLTYQNNYLSRKLDESQTKYDDRIHELENQMYKLQNEIIKENTIELHEFNLKNKS